MSPFVAVLVRYTANAAMFFGVLIAGLAGWDYWQGPAAGQRGPLIGVFIGIGVFLIGWRSFRKLARELAADHEAPADNTKESG